MSTGCECEFVEIAPGEWYLILEDDDAPKRSFDWLEYASAYGPFASEEETHEFLRDHFANPGGYWTVPYDPKGQLHEMVDRLVKDAPTNLAAMRRGRLRSV